LNLLKGVSVGSFDEQCHGFGIFDVFDKGVFFFAKGVFVDEPSPTKDIGCQIVNRILGSTTAE